LLLIPQIEQRHARHGGQLRGGTAETTPMLDRLMPVKVLLDHRDRLLDWREQLMGADGRVLGGETGGVRLDVTEHAFADVGVA
jgi:hypothetical protein